jgi:uncharacterized linocin/CFP29 family protein
MFAVSAGQRLLAANMDPGINRPYVDVDQKVYYDTLAGFDEEGSPIFDKHEIANYSGLGEAAVNATLRKDEWVAFDEVLVQAARDRLVGVQFLVDRGLVFNMDGMSSMILQTENVNDFSDAILSMSGTVDGDADRANFELVGLPLPIAQKDFNLDIRVLNASRKIGQSLDTTQAEQSGRKVAEKIESSLYNPGTYKVGAYNVYGLLTHPDRNTGTLRGAWDDSSTTGQMILDDVRDMKQAAISDSFYGPYALFIPTNYETALDNDFKANSDKTIRARIMEINNIDEILVADKMSDANVVLVQLTQDVVRVVNGLDPTLMQCACPEAFLLETPRGRSFMGAS